MKHFHNFDFYKRSLACWIGTLQILWYSEEAYLVLALFVFDIFQQNPQGVCRQVSSMQKVQKRFGGKTDPHNQVFRKKQKKRSVLYNWASPSTFVT